MKEDGTTPTSSSKNNFKIVIIVLVFAKNHSESCGFFYFMLEFPNRFQFHAHRYVISYRDFTIDSFCNSLKNQHLAILTSIFLHTWIFLTVASLDST